MADPRIKIGELAAIVMLHDDRDRPIALSDLWADAERGIVLAFLRHYG